MGNRGSLGMRLDSGPQDPTPEGADSHLPRAQPPLGRETRSSERLEWAAESPFCSAPGPPRVEGDPSRTECLWLLPRAAGAPTQSAEANQPGHNQAEHTSGVWSMGGTQLTFTTVSQHS